MLKKIPTTMHLISVRLSSLLFLRGALFFFLLFIFIHRLGWQEMSEQKPRQERKLKIVLPRQRLWKSLPLNSDDPLRWNCGSRDFIGLWCVIFGYLFEIMKQIVFIFCLPFLFSGKNFYGKYQFFCFAFSLSFLLVACIWLIWI